MPDPALYRPKPGEIPTSPGVYRFRDQYGRVIYVGKAINLRARLSSYFQDVAALHPRTQAMVTTAAQVDWTVVSNEVEALTLEYTWIKEFDPRFNVKYRDDKSYPYLAVTMSEEYPRALVTREAKRKGTRYFGPFGHAWAIRETLDLLLRVFPIRTCSAGVFKRAAQTGRPCLLGYIDKCAAPCVGKIDAAAHRQLAEDFCAFMAGDTGRFVKQLTAQMRAAAAEMAFERAARLRDDIATLEQALEKNAVVLPDATDADVFALAGDDLEAAVQVFHVRGGRVRGQRGWVVEKVAPLSDAELVEQLLGQVYAGYAAPLVAGSDATASNHAGANLSAVPREVLVPCLPSNHEQLTAWLSAIRGAKVSVRVPQRGAKRELSQTLHANAEHALALHRAKRAGDLTTRAAGMQQLQDALGLENAPLRIECYDISHTQGTYQSASMVVFEDGAPRKSEYRTFSIRGPEGEGTRDDTRAMAEVITRRFQRLAAARPAAPAGEEADTAAQPSLPDPKPDSFAYPPSLVVVDGGIPQVNAAQAALADLGITNVALVGLAKRLEEIWVPGRAQPVILERGSPGLYLMQRVRDEAHRFALRAHRKRRGKAMTVSALDAIPGLGPVRQQALLKHFGSVRRLRAATVAQLAEVPGIGAHTAEIVHASLRP